MDTSSESHEAKLINPCLVVGVNEKLFQAHDTTFAKEDWVKANDILMEQDGVESWLRAFLVTLSGSFRKSLASPVSPYHAIALMKPADTAQAASADSWVNDNIAVIDKLGKSQWLWAVLDMLESGTATR
jgi:hypothetical protein